MTTTISLKTKITTPHVAATQAFYARVLGLVAVEAWDDAGDRGVILAPSADGRDGLLEIYEGPASSFDGLSLQFKVADLAAFTAALPADVAFSGPTRRPWGSTYLYLRDPNGISVVVFEGGL